jgi:hypothetical protein
MNKYPLYSRINHKIDNQIALNIDFLADDDLSTGLTDCNTRQVDFSHQDANDVHLSEDGFDTPDLSLAHPLASEQLKKTFATTCKAMQKDLTIQSRYSCAQKPQLLKMTSVNGVPANTSQINFDHLREENDEVLTNCDTEFQNEMTCGTSTSTYRPRGSSNATSTSTKKRDLKMMATLRAKIAEKVA